MEQKIRKEYEKKMKYEVNNKVKEKLGKKNRWNLENIKVRIREDNLIHILLILLGVLIMLNIVFFLLL